MKKLIMISGTMGVGKTATCRELQKILPHNVFLDGDWCWDMNPFIVDSQTKAMVIKNICFLLNQYLNCSHYENVIFCWVMHQQSIIDDILSGLDTENCMIKSFSLIADKQSLIRRLKSDIDKGIRQESVIERSIERLNNYNLLKTDKIDVSRITPYKAAEIISSKL